MFGMEASLLALLILFPLTCLLDLRLSGYPSLIAGYVSFIFIIFTNVWDVEDLLALITADCAVGGA